MRIVITGGTGLIGRALGASLAGDGHEVIALSRGPERVAGLPAGMRAERWDGRSAAGWGPLAEGADAIVNLAGENLAAGRWTAERRRRLRDSRLRAGQAVVQAVEQAARKPRVVVQASGIGYSGHRGDEDVTESTAPGSDFLARLAVEWEACTAPVEALGVRRVVIRSAVVLSPAGGVLPVMVLPHRFFVGGRLGSGRQWLSWIHIADEVGAIRFLIQEEAARGVFNLVAPQPVTNAGFERILGRVLHRPAWFPTPALALRLLLGEMSQMVLEGQRGVPRRLVDLGYTFRYRGLEEALRNLLHERGLP